MLRALAHTVRVVGLLAVARKQLVLFAGALAAACFVLEHRSVVYNIKAHTRKDKAQG